MINLIVETLQIFIFGLYYCLEAVVLACIPKSLRQLKDVSGQVVVITGSASGLGRHLSMRFAALGCNIALWDINDRENDETREMVEECGVKAKCYHVNVADREQVYASAQEVLQEFGHVDILINNAGIVNGSLFLDTPDDNICRVIDVNFASHMWTLKAFLPSMLSRNRGHICSIASVAGLSGNHKVSDYCASKHAIVGFMDALAHELHVLRHPIKTTVICPYLMDTQLFRGCKSKYPLIFPTLRSTEVADRVVQAVLLNERVVYIPRIVYLMVVIKQIVPVKFFWTILTYLGMDDLLETFEGQRSGH